MRMHWILGLVVGASPPLAWAHGHGRTSSGTQSQMGQPGISQGQIAQNQGQGQGQGQGTVREDWDPGLTNYGQQPLYGQVQPQPQAFPQQFQQFPQAQQQLQQRQQSQQGQLQQGQGQQGQLQQGQQGQQGQLPQGQLQQSLARSSHSVPGSLQLVGESQVTEIRELPELVGTAGIVGAAPEIQRVVGVNAVDRVYQTTHSYSDTVRFFDRHFRSNNMQVLARSVTPTATAWSVRLPSGDTASAVVRNTSPTTVEVIDIAAATSAMPQGQQGQQGQQQNPFMGTQQQYNE